MLTIQSKGPDILKRAIKLYSYEICIQNKPDDFPNQTAYDEHLRNAELKKDILYKDFNEPPENWNEELFGYYQPVRIIKTSIPPSMKSASKANYRTAYIAVAGEISDRLQLDGDLGRLQYFGCTCSYKAGSLGNFVSFKIMLLVIFVLH